MKRFAESSILMDDSEYANPFSLAVYIMITLLITMSSHVLVSHAYDAGSARRC